MIWHVFDFDLPMRLFRCVPPTIGGTRAEDCCEGCGLEVTCAEVEKVWGSDVPRPINSTLNLTAMAVQRG